MVSANIRKPKGLGQIAKCSFLRLFGHFWIWSFIKGVFLEHPCVLLQKLFRKAIPSSSRHLSMEDYKHCMHTHKQDCMPSKSYLGKPGLSAWISMRASMTSYCYHLEQLIAGTWVVSIEWYTSSVHTIFLLAHMYS